MAQKIAILLFGISYNNNYKNGKINYNHIIDCRYFFNNFNEYCINYFKEKDYSIDIFITSNKNQIEKEIIDIYKPVDYIFNENYVQRNGKIRKGLNLIRNYEFQKNFKYDIFLITRFDIFFTIKFEDKFFNLNKLNLVSILEKNYLIDDNFYLFPSKYFLKFIEIFENCNDNYKEEAHNLKNIFDNNFEINYIYNQNTTVENLSFFKLRFFQNYNFNFILNDEIFIKNVYKNIDYRTKNNNALFKIDNHDVIYLSKINIPKTPFVWFAYNLFENSNYKLSFEILSDKDINNYDFIKLHNPIRFLKINKKININEWNFIEINFSTNDKKDLLCFIFDNFNGKINLKFKNIEFNILFL